jgi:hypothetical protein
MPEPLLAPLAVGGEADDQVGRDDQAVPLPPARVPLALARDRDADQCLGEQHETRDHGRRQQVRPVAEDRPVARRADGVDERSDDRHDGEQVARRRLAVRPAERRQVRNRPGEPRRHDQQHSGAQEPAVANHQRRQLRPDVDERRCRREDGAHEQPYRDGDLEAGVVLGEQDPGRSEGMEAHEAARRHERERQEKDACVPAPLGRLTGGEAESERNGAHEPEEHEVEPGVDEVGVELGTKQQRHEPDQRQRDGRERGNGSRAHTPARGARILRVRGIEKTIARGRGFHSHLTSGRPTAFPSSNSL